MVAALIFSKPLWLLVCVFINYMYMYMYVLCLLLAWDTWIFLYTPTNINTTLFCDSYINQHAQVGIYTCNLCSYFTFTSLQAKIVYLKMLLGWLEKLKCNLCSYFTFTSLQAKIVYLKMLLGWLEKLKSSSEGCGNAMYQTLIKSVLLTDNLSHEHHNFKEIKPQPKQCIINTCPHRWSNLL